MLIAAGQIIDIGTNLGRVPSENCVTVKECVF